ncbi:ABC transporter substrate-binding protein [Fulvivirga sp. M361]|uniref:ABC transporter substrate-binding protein n=1 Tax=Fulvivirga sp. M361 TaxID=2594266 RepID=UPI00117AFAF9|nr:helical backbone metal receptor [Fulvivirga sp. M361]TRX53781.1 ABC transporter substrate-binding protein [Fulvivirga sp. M361]
MIKLKTVKDQIGKELQIPYFPAKIISLVPSQTELLFYLGMGAKVVGVTKFCVHPLHARSKTIIGGTKKFNFDKIYRLSPDLILGNKEENYAQGIFELGKNYPVWVSDIFNLQDATDMIMQIGQLVNKADRANQLVTKIEDRFSSLEAMKTKKGRALYFIWREPYMVAGGNTFINAMLEYAGFENAAAHLDRYPELSEEDIKKLNPDYLLLSSEPFPFTTKYINDFQLKFKSKNIHLVDGEYFSWYGDRLLGAADYFEKLSV